jgi:probable addiction module antidote protein
MPKRTRSFKAGQLERLRDPTYAAEYINAAMEAGDESAFLLSLRNVAEAQTMNAVATGAGLSRESLYRMLSETGNPRYTSLLGILNALGLQFKIQPTAAQASACESCSSKEEIVASSQTKEYIYIIQGASYLFDLDETPAQHFDAFGPANCISGGSFVN